MKIKRIALWVFSIPFVLGGSFSAICTMSDLFSNPDRPDEQIILLGLADFAYGGTIFGVLSLAICFSLLGLVALAKKALAKVSKK